MKLIIPFVRRSTPPFTQGGSLRPEVRDLGQRLGADFIDLTGDNQGYWRLLASLWAKGESFIVVEQDVLPTAGMLREMWDCDQPWCSGWYEQNGQRIGPNLACNRFTASLIKACPYAIGAAAAEGWTPLWTQCDLRVLPALAGCGFTPHLHDPAVRHLHR